MVLEIPSQQNKNKAYGATGRGVGGKAGGKAGGHVVPC